jgi:hypothetical protein
MGSQTVFTIQNTHVCSQTLRPCIHHALEQARDMPLNINDL